MSYVHHHGTFILSQVTINYCFVLVLNIDRQIVRLFVKKYNSQAKLM